MPTIKIDHLQPAGAELFQDSESYLNELSSEDTRVVGGDAQVVFISVVTQTIGVNSQVTVSMGISLQSLSVVSVVRSLPRF
ncbi:hypothetical protein LEP3755_36250 [Leptolyngbya sp. NIES-3755]|nr:hypothetical protein LEP3755_36250 [Leptolyngbya sp. NIES-3755]